jgi:predicted nucleic acid-binding protein
MRAERFLDTNVLIYAFAKDDARSTRAENLLAEGGVIGVQVLNEFTSVTRRKLRWRWEDIESALGVIEDLLGPARSLTAVIHARAVALAREHDLAFYVALIVAAAEEAGCRELLSEDLQHGRKFGALRIENPFLS